MTCHTGAAMTVLNTVLQQRKPIKTAVAQTVELEGAQRVHTSYKPLPCKALNGVRGSETKLK